MVNYQVSWKYRPFLFLIDLIGNVIFFYKKIFKKGFKKEDVKKILIIRVDEIGDVVLTTPLISTLKKEFPKAKLCVIVKKSSAELLKYNPHVDEIYITKSWFKEKISFREFMQLIKKLRKENFDLVFDPHADPRNIILAYFVGKYKVGYNIRGFGFLLDFVVQYKDKHIMETILDLARILGLKKINKKMEVYFSKKDEMKINKLFKRHKLKRNKLLICINPGTGRKNKEWPVQNWKSLTGLLIKKYNCQIIFTGNDEENKLINEIIGKNKSCYNFSGKTNLLQLSALIKKCDLLIAPDTGSLHIARALNVPLVGLFGPVDPAIWGYSEEKYRSIYKKLDCSFCNMPTCRGTLENNKCMTGITVADVFKEISRLVK